MRWNLERRLPRSIDYIDWKMVKEIIEALKESEPELHDTDIEFRCEEEYGTPSCYIFYMSPETVEERAVRVADEAKWAASREAAERKVYEDLKKKFEGQ